MNYSEVSLIQTQDVRRIVAAYADYYYMNAIDEDGNTVTGKERGFRVHDHTAHICEQCNWERIQRSLLPIASRVAESIPNTKGMAIYGNTISQFKMMWTKIKTNPDANKAIRNPLNVDPVILIHKTNKPSWAAGYISNRLSAPLIKTVSGVKTYYGQHIVFRLSKSTGLDMMYDHDRKQALVDIMAFAPVLVYAEVEDKRNGSTVYDMLELRQYGLTVVLESK